MTQTYGRISGWGTYVPDQQISNYDLEEILDTSHEWIVKRTGIINRRIAGDGETTASMAIKASKRALEKARLEADDLDLIIVATSTPDYVTPPVSSQVQHGLEAPGVPAFVLQNACSGFVYALTTAYQYIQSGAYETVLVVGADMISRSLNWEDRSTAVLFGDGAGAFIIQATDEPTGLESFILGSDGSGADYIIIPASGVAEPVSVMSLAQDRQYLQMNGGPVFKFATNILEKVTHQITEQANISLDEIDWIVPHQANVRIIQNAARRLQVPLSKFVMNLDEYGNTWAASIPLALAEALDSGQVKPHDKVLLVSFGAGLTWGAALMQMAPVSEITYQETAVSLAEPHNELDAAGLRQDQPSTCCIETKGKNNERDEFT